MADRNVESDTIGVPKLDETLEILLLQVIEEAQQRMEDGEDVVPFTALLVGDSVFEETHNGTTDECFASAQKTVEGAEGARAYAFCYDGYIENRRCWRQRRHHCRGEASRAKKDGVAVGLLYDASREEIAFEEEVCYIAEAPNFLASKEPVPAIIEDERGVTHPLGFPIEVRP